MASSSAPGVRALFIPLLLALALMIIQASALVHDHGDLEPRYDCELCQKLTSADAIPVVYTSPQIPASGSYVSPTAAAIPLLPLRSANARAPPSILA